MTHNQLIWPFLHRHPILQLAQWFIGLLTALCLVISMSVTAGTHPYERWAKELGIDMNVSYDGTRVLEFKEGSFEATERRAPGMMYTEVHIEGTSSGVIVREDLQKSYVLMPSMGVYMEKSLKDGMQEASNGMVFSKIEKVGREKVIGLPSTKYKTRFKDNEGKGTGIIWVTDSGVPIKMDMTYTSRNMKNERYVMHFTELNLRKQDPAFFEPPANLKPMGMGSIGDMMKMGAASQATAPASPAAPPAVASTAKLSDEQQACLKTAAAKAAEDREKAESKKGFGRLLGSLSRTASRFGITDIGEITRDIYEADATADDVAVIAEELGITEEDVVRCQNP
jgi:hypothetical protein